MKENKDGQLLAVLLLVVGGMNLQLLVLHFLHLINKDKEKHSTKGRFMRPFFISNLSFK
jgi:hypothetical protein